MHPIITALFCVAAIGLAASDAGAQGIDFERRSWEKVKSKARKAGKPIFVDAYTTWCGPCIWMAKNVFTDREVGAFFNENFVSVQIDVEEGEGVAFADEYGVRVYPTLLFIDADGNLLHQQLGASGASDLIALGEVALDPDRRIGEMMKAYENGNRDSDFLMEYIGRLLDSGIDPKGISTEYFGMLSDRELVTRENFELIESLSPSFDSEIFETLVKYREDYYSVTPASDVDSLIKSAVIAAVSKAIYLDDTLQLDAIEARISTLQVPFNRELLLYLQMKEAWADGDYDTFLEAGEAYTTQYAWDDWNDLNTMAWEIYLDNYTHSDYLNFAVRLARRSVELDENYYNCDTYAAVLFKSGQYEKAERWALRAIDHAEQLNIEPQQTRGLLQKIRILSE